MLWYEQCGQVVEQVCTIYKILSPTGKEIFSADVKETLGAKGSWTSCNMLANKLFMEDFMKNYHNEIANLLENGLEVDLFALYK